MTKKGTSYTNSAKKEYDNSKALENNITYPKFASTQIQYIKY